MENQDETAPDPAVPRTEAFVRRRRRPASPQPKVEELPVLTEVIPAAAESLLLMEDKEEVSPAEKPEPASLDPDVLDILAHELARRLRERLAAELPGLVEAALAGLTRELQQSLTTSAETAIGDFVAERARLAKLQPGR